MASEYSFDVVSKVDGNLVDEAISIAMKEIVNRYDFRGSDSDIKFDKKTNVIQMFSADEYKIKALFDVLLTKLAKRNLPLKNFKPQKIENSLGGKVKQQVTVQQGIPQDKAKEMIKAVKEKKFKVNISIQGDSLRVSSKSKDELQNVMSFLRGGDYCLSLQFDNFR